MKHMISIFLDYSSIPYLKIIINKHYYTSPFPYAVRVWWYERET